MRRHAFRVMFNNLFGDNHMLGLTVCGLLIIVMAGFRVHKLHKEQSSTFMLTYWWMCIGIGCIAVIFCTVQMILMEL